MAKDKGARPRVAPISTRPPKGTRDLYPDDMRFRSWLFGHFREVARRFGYEEVDAPLVEHAELYKRKAGEDIVEQLYHFELHGRELALRAEMTPSLARIPSFGRCTARISRPLGSGCWRSPIGLSSA